MPQRTFYDAGVGVSTNRFDRLRGGAFGIGIDQNIKELYTFIATHYTEGDEIFLFGFSRGAYTVRSLAGMMQKTGLVRGNHAEIIDNAYKMYRDRSIKPSSKTATDFRAAHGDRVPIKLIACFDTVGSLGVPDMLPWPLSILSDEEKYRFHDTRLGDQVENAVHALSIDEDKRSFIPTLMTPSDGKSVGQVTELYMAGYHGGVGGGNAVEPLLAENAMRFMVDEIGRRGLGIKFDMDQIPNGGNINVEPSKRQTFIDGVLKFITGDAVRNVESVDRIHPWALDRFVKVGLWRPKALENLAAQIKDKVRGDGSSSDSS